MKTMTIRNIPDEVASALADHARETGRSMNATAVSALTMAFAPAVSKPKRDLSEFAGIMTPEEAADFERIIEEDCERIDPGEWPGLPPSAFAPWPSRLPRPVP
ncbi:MAG: hypothetical protein IKQ55_05370 [Kiritimatiellae bacterium]|nr:hypothetical protein [Kiritimatiellia bacterium]